MRTFLIAVVSAVLASSVLAEDDAPVPLWLHAAADDMLRIAATNNPRLGAAAAEWRAAKLDAEAFDGFFMPRVSASAGGGKGAANAPESMLPPYFGGDTAGVQAGLLLPLRAGAYLGAGVAQRYLFRADGFEDLGQTAAGVRLSVPLLRDKGFRIQNLNQTARDKMSEIALLDRHSTALAVAREALWRYAALLYAAADVRESRNALARVQGLLDETTNRLEMQTIAAYQVHGARMEVRFRQDELRQSQLAQARAEEALKATLAVQELSVDDSPELLHAWSAFCAAQDYEGIMAAASVRPELAAAVLALEVEGYLSESTREELRSNLTLEAGLGYRGEDEDGGFGRDDILGKDQVGFEVALVWRRPLAFDAEDARARAQEAREAARRHQLRQVELQLEDEMEQAKHALRAAHDRLDIVAQAVTEARRALAAEEERLGLGEGRNRNVLDAQKDLTDAERRSNLAAYEMIIAHTEMLRAAGITLIATEVSNGPIVPTP